MIITSLARGIVVLLTITRSGRAPVRSEDNAFSLHTEGKTSDRRFILMMRLSRGPIYYGRFRRVSKLIG